MTGPASNPADGVRLLSQRPSLLHKVAELVGDVDQAAGVTMAGPGWETRLRAAVDQLAPNERAGIFAIPLGDPDAVPTAVQIILERQRTDWFPAFLFRGRMHSVFQPIVDLTTGAVYGREALIRGSLGRGEVSGAELVAAAVAHDALFSFDARTRTTALQNGLPLLPAGEKLFVKLDMRAVMDIEGTLRSTWPAVETAGGRADQVGLELMGADVHPDLDLLCDLAAAHRERGATLALDDLSVSTATVRVLEAVRPEIIKLSRSLCKEAQTSPGRRHLVGALVEVAHELGARVVAVGIERDDDLEHVRALGVDLGQGFYLGQPTPEMLPVQRPVSVRATA